uniref:Retrovirus-related Pol polyprotein from transposon TNT 1-94 n=1 Tax=Cajanus cajan TaxID=3821 RepID=A0A151S5K7_CAJCA|nr:hypothetical protein KK1_028093 [Cajanus cajan]
MHTLGISPPDANWYMDTGATSHMTSAQGNLTSYFNMSNKHGIIVGNGYSIPIHGYGHTKLSSLCPPLTLNNVLHAPQLVKNLVSVRKFTTDNFVSVEFDPFGFSVKDFQTGRPVMRCESQGELYPITKPTNPYTFTTVAPSLWHDRLGDPGVPVLNSLRKNKLIKCNQIKDSLICHSCPLGKHVKLSFYASNSCTIMPFDIIHSDLWTSPILSSSGHRYYVLFVDDYSKFLWTFSLSQKSQTYSTFLNFKYLIRTQFERDIYKRFANYVRTLGFSHNTLDHSLFIYRQGNSMAHLLLYVDDIILTASFDELRKSIISLLSSKFAMKDLGHLSYFLGINVTRHAGGLLLSIKKYAVEIIDRAGMSSCKPSPTPVDTKPKISVATSTPFEDPSLYRSLVGALQYLTFTRPDITYVVQQVCLFMHDLREAHMYALKRILRYIQGTMDLGLHLYPSSTSTPLSYTDVDWGG